MLTVRAKDDSLQVALAASQRLDSFLTLAIWELTDMRGMVRLSNAIQGDIEAMDKRAGALADRWESAKSRGDQALAQFEGHIQNTEAAVTEVEAFVKQLTNGGAASPQ